MASQRPSDGDSVPFGNDETPWMSYVPEPPPSHWGKTLTDRTRSEAYTKFRLRARQQHEKPNSEENDNGR